ncbi:FERM domain-containing protein 8 isoform X2 [Patagioenas fasciata]|uniref:FERM domain-containing protein 8 isoform X2 n=1 Tax=Patagioenas fasciata TaxID=372321 RepID=UPI003A995F07
MEGEGASGAPGAHAPPALLFLPDGSAVPLALDPPPGPTAGELLRHLQEALRLPPVASEALALWLSSPMLEVQLKPRHRPLRLARQWPELLLRFSTGSAGDIARDEPSLQLRRSVFFPKSRELEVQEEALLRLLAGAAREQLLSGRWALEPPQSLQLGALLCRMDLGPFDPQQHTAEALRPLLPSLLPRARGRSRLGALLRWGSRGPAPEEQLRAAFAETPAGPAPPARLCRDFLRKCHRARGYGCAFFPGAIERPPAGLLGRGGLRPVSVAVGLEGVTITDPREQQVLLSLTYPELCWELVGAVGQDGAAVGQDGAAVGQEPPQLWLEFDGEHEGAPVNRLLRVFSPQAELMSALIECCIELGGAGPAPSPPPGEATPTDEDAPRDEAPPPGDEAPPPGAAPLPPAGAPLRRHQSSGPRRLATIDYVRDGQQLRRVQPPRRSASFFTRGERG